jgi:lysozyme
MTEKGLELIKNFEGFEPNAYKCPAGIITIGYGATYYMDGTKVKMGDTITKEEAEKLLNEMSEKKYGIYVDEYVKSEINPYQRDALISFAYNCGNSALKNSTLLKKVNKNPMDETISNEFLKWNKSGGKVLNGLTRRRQAEADLYFTEYIEPQELTFRGHLEN